MSEEKDKQTAEGGAAGAEDAAEKKEEAEPGLEAGDADDPQVRAGAAEQRAVRQTKKAKEEAKAEAPEADDKAADVGTSDDEGKEAPAADDKAAALARAKAKAAAAAKARAAGAGGGAKAPARPRAGGAGGAGGRRRPPRRKAEEKPKEPFAAHQVFLKELKQAFEGIDFKEHLDSSDELVIEVPAEKIIEVSEYLRDEWGLNYLRSLSGVDWKDRLEAVYSLAAIDAGGSASHRVLEAPEGAHAGSGATAKAEAVEAAADGEGAEEGEGAEAKKDAAKPGGPPKVPFRLGMHVSIDRDRAEIDSVTPVWPAADFHEREAFDMFGIVFKGHPNLQRILLPENWQGGYPLRKDFVDKRPKKDRKVRPR